jgi:hypothetical protein
MYLWRRGLGNRRSTASANITGLRSSRGRRPSNERRERRNGENGRCNKDLGTMDIPPIEALILEQIAHSNWRAL